ncbi:MAG: ribose-phosphate diphosphokinase [Deltaproteobacteria bacterium]|nr:ribose-phosphate diphosphokinase [Deltaproteobacteria bacterium]
MRAPLLLSIPSDESYADALARHLDSAYGVIVEVGRVERREFPDGERYQRILSQTHERAVVLVGGTGSDVDTLTLYDLACACVKYGARRLDVCVPYFGYSTMERAVHPGEVVTAKTRARLLSAIPHAEGGNHFYLLDLHSEGLPHYFEGDVITEHLSALPLLRSRLRQIHGGDFVLGSTDAGRAKWVERLANELGVEAALIVKRRLSGAETEVVAMNAQVAGRAVVIYDDMIRTGGSLLQAARAYLDGGAREVWAACSHGVLPEGAWERLRDSGLLRGVIATDSHPRARALGAAGAAGLELLPSAPLFAEALAARSMRRLRS